MAKIDRIVNVQIALNTTAIKEQTFSDLLALAPHVLTTQRSLVITEADELLDYGLSATDPLYLLAQDVFSQIPTITRLFIGRQQVNSVVVTVTQASESEYSVVVGWRDVNGDLQTATYAITAAPGDLVGDIATDLAAAINGGAAPVTAAAVGAVITITADVAGAPFSAVIGGNLSMATPVTAELPAVALAAISEETDDWYGVVMTDRDNADILNAADWVEANEKLLGVGISAVAAYDPGSTTDLGYLLMQGQYFRTHWWFHRNISTEWLEAAISAKSFTIYPGGETWALKNLQGVSFDTLSEGQSLAIRNKNGNTFEQFRNFAVTQNGKVAAGEWIDVIRFRDWLAEQVKINVVSAMINADGKIPYTDEGIQIIVTALRQALDLGVTRKGIAPVETDPITQRTIPSYTISAPAAANVPFNDKANRVLNDVKFTARLAGAIHTTVIRGNLTYVL
jgi:hypothetical protein